MGVEKNGGEILRVIVGGLAGQSVGPGIEAEISRDKRSKIGAAVQPYPLTAFPYPAVELCALLVEVFRLGPCFPLSNPIGVLATEPELLSKVVYEFVMRRRDPGVLH